ncbi:MAG: deoxycytidylate deaminase [Candidatus Hadarchaeota archaeon]
MKKNKDERPTKSKYYLGIAKAVCKRSPCIRRQYGAIIVKDDAIVSTGYNGPPRGVINCNEVGCLKEERDLPHYGSYDYCIAVHAEENSVINAARHGARVLNGTLYLYGREYDTGNTVKGKPCNRCKRTIINAGIKKVITEETDGSVEKYDVADWISQDTENYINKLKKTRKKSR